MTGNEIAVGIPTEGEPVLVREGENTRLRNMRIGLGFHWEQTVEALLPGRIELHDDPVFSVINRLPVETYLEAVVGSEMNPNAPAEFLKAHAVISRSWAVGKIRGDHPSDGDGKIFSEDRILTWEDTCDHRGFDVCSDDHCQRYQGIQPIPESTMRAIRSTEGLILTSKAGRPVDTRFSKCCGGRTEVFASCWQDRAEDCLESFEDPWCDLSGLSADDRRRVLSSVLKEYDLENGGGYRWTAEISKKEVRENLSLKFGRDIGEIVDLKILERGPSGRVIRMEIEGERGTIELGKELMVRRLLAPTHLYSSGFEIVGLDEERYRLEGRGWGHGVGLCQIGAARMALAGRNFEEILSFYYPGSKIVNHKNG